MNGYRFVKGIVLAERLYHEGVKPVMEQHFPEVRYSAGRLRIPACRRGKDGR